MLLGLGNIGVGPPVGQRKLKSFVGVLQFERKAQRCLDIMFDVCTQNVEHPHHIDRAFFAVSEDLFIEKLEYSDSQTGTLSRRT